MPHRPGYQDALNLTISLCLTYTLCVAGVRIWIRKRSFGLDDFVIGISTIVTICNSAANYVALAEGLGLPWADVRDASSKTYLNEASIAGIVTFTVALYVSKCAMLFFLSRITKTPKQLRLFLICNIFTAVVGVASVLIATVGCPAGSGYYWAFHANRPTCPMQSARWQAITGLDVITEVELLVLPVYLVWGLQMALRKKALLIIAFYLRLPVLGFSIARNYYTLQLRLPQTDPGLGSTLVTIFLSVELAYALAASTLSALKAFTESFNSDFGLGFTRGKGDGSYGMSNLSGNSGQSGQSSKTEQSKDVAALDSSTGASRMGSITQAKENMQVLVSPATHTPPARTIEEAAPLPASLKLRPETELKTFTRVSAEPSYAEHEPWREYSSGSSQSSGPDNDMIIVRETAYEVQHDEAPILPWATHPAYRTERVVA